jgi:hypothetical protein
MSDKSKIIPLEEVLLRFEDHKKVFKQELQREENSERIESLDAIQNDIKGVRQNTELKKIKFISELKNGLGEKVKKNPTTIKKIHNKWYQRLGLVIKRIFIKF